MSTKQLLKDAFGWGFILWLIGYVLGMAFFFILPTQYIGWAITPIAVLITLWILLKKIKYEGYLAIAFIWTSIAILLDYVFIVKALSPADGYYKLDVYIYYVLTFAMPIAVGAWKGRKAEGKN